MSLERALQQYSQNVTDKPFDIKTVPTIVITQTETHKSNDQVLPSSKAFKPTEKSAASRQDIFSGIFFFALKCLLNYSLIFLN